MATASRPVSALLVLPKFVRPWTQRVLLSEDLWPWRALRVAVILDWSADHRGGSHEFRRT